MASTAFETQMRSGVVALQANDPTMARRAFEAAARIGDTGQLHLYLAHSCLLLGDRDAADAALDRVLGHENTNLYALCMKGDIAAGRGEERSASSYYGFALAAAEGQQVSPDLAERLQAAQSYVGTAQGRYRARLDAALAGAAQPPRFREAMAILTGEAPVYPQQPSSFFYPRLAPIPFFETAGLDWVAALEAAAPAIRAELEALLAGDSGFAPYVQAEPGRPHREHALLGDARWSALHLWKGGVPVADLQARCPETVKALARAPIPHIAGRSPMALFSRLEPHTHIPPHNGLLNTRLICHLPLIVPAGCRLRVGAETRAVEPGEVMLFDDSIEHEAWNDSDETRVVLLFEVWRPELDAEERALLTRMFETVVDYA